MQATSSRVPTVKSRAPVLKQRYDVWSGPGPIATFVRCLRLLDLDILDDWPGITEHTFSTHPLKQNLQSRIRCVEWGLYRLFELWDPAETRDRLRPFFPPLTPLQSLNLRAALYRALTDLKKDGVLDKEILLRKTMLDECKGDKFEEVICAFALTVLRKGFRAMNDARLELSYSNRMTSEQEALLLPLIIAHRRSLHQLVSQHRQIKEHAQAYSGLLAQRRASIEDRCSRLSRLPVPEAEEKAKTYQDIPDLWMSENSWAEILVSGPKRFEDQFLRTPFEKGWKAVLDGSIIDICHQTNLLEDLGARIASQETRLRKWETISVSLNKTQAQRQDAPSAQAWPERNNSTVPHFDKHQSLHRFDKPSMPRSVDQHFPTIFIHEALLVLFKADLAILRKSNIAKQSTARGEQFADLCQLSKTPLEASSPLPVSTPFSHRNNELSITGDKLCKDDSTRSLELKPITYQQVKTITHRISDSFHAHSPKQFSPIIDQTKSSTKRVLVYSDDQPTSSAQEKYFAAEINPFEEVQPQIESDKYWTTGSFSRITRSTSKSVSSRWDTYDSEELAEPLAIGFPLSSSTLETDSTIKRANGVQNMVAPITLLERTRQSISLLPSAERARLRSSEKRVSSQQVRLSQTFPINEFDTPCNTKRNESSQLGTILPSSGSSTPRDELFSDAAAYDSVFKSRPRIALSPTLSPTRTTIGLDSMLEENLADACM